MTLPDILPQRSRRISLALILIIIGLLGACSLALAQAEITFQYNPPKPTSFVLIEKKTTEESMGKRKLNTVYESRTRVNIVGEDNGGWAMTYTPVSAFITVNGKREAVKISGTMTYHLDAKGALVKIDGLQEAVDKAAAQLPEGKFDKAKALAMLEKPRKEQWEDEIIRYLGKTVKLGEAWNVTMPVEYSKGAVVPSRVSINFAEQLERDGRPCVRLTIDQQTAPGEFKKMIADEIDGIAKGLSATQRAQLPTVKKADGHNIVSRIIDPSTMLVYGEYTTRGVDITMYDPGKGTVVTRLREYQLFSFEYDR